jgi:hypothetical protein
MMDVLLVVSMMLLLSTMVMLIMVLNTLTNKLEEQNDTIDYWREKALVTNSQEIELRMKQGLWMD